MDFDIRPTYHFVIIDSMWSINKSWRYAVYYCSNGGPSRVTLQDIVRSDPGYTPNIEHLVFPERKSSNPNLAGVADGSPPTKSKSNATSSGRSRLAEVFARHYARGSSQDSSITSRKNHVNVRIRDLIVRKSSFICRSVFHCHKQKRLKCVFLDLYMFFESIR